MRAVLSISLLLLLAGLGCGPKEPRTPSRWADFECKDRKAAYFVVGSMAADEAGVTIECAGGPKVTRWTVEKDGTRIEDSAAMSPGEFDDVFLRIDSIGWKNLGDCPPEGGADVPVFTFDLADWNGTATFQCDALNPPYPYNTIVDELDQLAATIRGDRGKNTIDVDDSDLDEIQ